MKNQTYAQALAAVNAGEFAQRPSSPSLYIGLKNGQVWQSGASPAGQAYTATEEDKNAVDWVTGVDVLKPAGDAVAKYPLHNDPRQTKPGALPDIPGHLVIQLPTDPVAATNALNAAESNGYRFEAVYTNMGIAFAVMCLGTVPVLK